LAQTEPGAAAVASRQAAVRYGLRILAPDIEDYPFNETRFAVIGHQETQKTGHDKTAIMFKVAHAAGARVTAHVFGEDALPGLINAGIDCIEHGTGLTDDTISLMAANGTALVPTLINIETFPGIADKAGKYPKYANHMRDLHARVSTTVASAIEAGVPVYAGTDAGGGIQHGRIVDEIVALHGVGMSAVDAIGAASWGAREWLGFPSLTEGAAADIVVYDEDPRENLETLRSPRMIMLRGRIH
jgi:imidazolonepropionase-like amidohydrolase